jgi:hypothetical protein
VLAENEDLLLAKALLGGAYSGVGLTLSTDPEHVALRSAWYASPGRRIIEELKGYWRVRLLHDAMFRTTQQPTENCFWLITLVGRVPDGVFIPLRGTPGNTTARSTQDIHKIWILNKRCTPTQLAVQVHPGFLRLAPKHRDRLARADMRRVKYFNKKLAPVTR